MASNQIERLRMMGARALVVAPARRRGPRRRAWKKMCHEPLPRPGLRAVEPRKPVRRPEITRSKSVLLTGSVAARVRTCALHTDRIRAPPGARMPRRCADAESKGATYLGSSFLRTEPVRVSWSSGTGFVKSTFSASGSPPRRSGALKVIRFDGAELQGRRRSARSSARQSKQSW